MNGVIYHDLSYTVLGRSDLVSSIKSVQRKMGLVKEEKKRREEMDISCLLDSKRSLRNPERPRMLFLCTNKDALILSSYQEINMNCLK